MTDKKAASILLALMKKHSLQGEEKQAIESAIGILSWTSLSESRIKSLKDKLEKKKTGL